MKITIIQFYFLVHREIARFFKVIAQTIISPLISSILYFLIFGVSFGDRIGVQAGKSYLLFLIPGLVIMWAVNSAFQNSSSSIVASKFSGDLEDLKTLPLTYEQIIWSYTIGGVFRGALVGLLTMLVGFIFVFFKQGEWISVHSWGLFLFFLIVSGMVFSKIGIAIAIWAKTFDQLGAFNAFILIPFTYLGGVFLSIDTLSPFWQSLSKLNPLLYFVNGFRYGLIGVSDVDIFTSVMVSLIGLVVFHALALWSLKNGSYSRW